MDSIKIHTKSPMLEIESTPAKLHITTPKPAMKITNSRPVMRVRRKAPTFKMVSNKPVKGGTANPCAEKTIYKYRNRARQLKLQAAADEAANKQEGAKHTKQAAEIIDAAREKAEKAPDRLNVSLAPKERPSLEWENGELIIEWETSDLHIEWDGLGRPSIEVEPHSVEVRVKNHASVKIYVAKDSHKESVGGKIDKKV